MAGGFHLTSALAFLNKGEGQWSDGGKSNMDNDDHADANDMSGDEDDPCIRKQTYNWRQDHHEKGEGGTEASQYRWPPKPKLVRKFSSSSSDQMAIQ